MESDHRTVHLLVLAVADPVELNVVVRDLWDTGAVRTCDWTTEIS
jgi:hypothetical protein